MDPLNKRNFLQDQYQAECSSHEKINTNNNRASVNECTGKINNLKKRMRTAQFDHYEPAPKKVKRLEMPEAKYEGIVKLKGKDSYIKPSILRNIFHKYARLNALHKATLLFEELHNNNISISNTTINIMADSCVRYKKPSFALLLLDMLKNEQIKPTRYMLNRLSELPSQHFYSNDRKLSVAFEPNPKLEPKVGRDQDISINHDEDESTEIMWWHDFSRIDLNKPIESMIETRYI